MDDWKDLKDVLYAADTDTAELILRLQTEDAQALSLEYRTHHEVPGRDTYIASGLYRHDLRDLQQDIPSRQLGEQLEEHDNEEEEAFEAAAFGWKLKQWEGHVEHVPDPEPPVQLIACTSCADDFHPKDIMQAPCSHHYCRACLEYTYNTSMVDETLFPPRCCHQDFPWDLARRYLSQRCKSAFGSKRVELETKDRTYCHEPTCSAFIKSDYIDTVSNTAVCPKCRAHTCTECKNANHYGWCPRDAAMETLMEAADQEGWQRCSVCRRILELKYGCNHMTCICKHEFCYVCGETWKGCTCPQWDEARLIERAARNVDHVIAPAANPGLDREAQIARAAENLRNNHECTHEHFRTFRDFVGHLACEICETEYLHWIRQCRQCLMFICGTCQRHRL